MPTGDKGVGDSTIEAQLKYCGTILTKMKRNQNAGPFLRPVDPVALNILDYFEKIKNPMDISTIKKKLDTHQYATPEDFNKDVNLMFNNCYTYNAPETPVYVMGQELQKYYDSLYSKMNQPVKRQASSPIKGQEGTKRIQRSVPLPPEDAKKCTEILEALDTPSARRFSSIFWRPVSPDEAPDYHKIIGKPMDLGTIKQKLQKNQYGSIQEFKDDLNLVVSNCLAYNAPETLAYECGKELEKSITKFMEGEEDVLTRINDLRQKIAAMSAELRMLEAKVGSKKHVYTLSDRERIGKAVLKLERGQSEKIAEITQRHGVYEYIDNDEIEINLHTMPDEVVGEIEEYLRKAKGASSVQVAPSNSSEE